MKVGEVVRFRGKDYRVGPHKTKTSVELVELKDGERGLWVSREEVCKAPQEIEQSGATVDL